MTQLLIRKVFFFVFVFAFMSSCRLSEDNTIQLAGEWDLCLDSTNVESIDDLSFDSQVKLPGTLDENGFGKENAMKPQMNREVMLHLQRKHEYIGKAWYRKVIVVPEIENSTRAILKLERVLWKSTVYVDGELVGHEHSLSVPHQYDLSDVLSPGKHELLICIDNSRQFELNKNDMAHAYTSETQIKWNGILGDFAIYFLPASEISDIQVFPNYKEKKLTVKIDGVFDKNHELKLAVKDKDDKIEVSETIQPNPSGIYSLIMPDDIVSWNEFSPVVYTLELSLFDNGNKIQTETLDFGFRNIAANGTKLTINGNPLFLRGTLECAIFPLTGHPPMSVAEWTKLYKSVKAYGLNHIRFHSWCPPRAAFVAADNMGVYLQVELPNWNTAFGADSVSAEFIEKEAKQIIEIYGNHLSFCFMSMGNELQGDLLRVNNLVKRLKQLDNRRLYTTTSFTFDRGHGRFPEPVDDYFITQYTDSGWVRGQGVFDSEYPNFNTDYTHAVKHLPVPLITHEIGQYSVFPNLKEIEKYTGVLDPLNFKAIKNDLQEKGLLHLADDYLMASGQLASLLYKEEIERALKTDGISGFQLLDLHDFPGQGTALVGLLDAFWDSKGIIDSSEFKNFCCELVPLVWMEKAVYKNSEQLIAQFGLANYSKSLNHQPLLLELIDANGRLNQQYEITVDEVECGKTLKLGEVAFELEDIKAAARFVLKLSLPGTSYQNSWSVWVYPEKNINNVQGNEIFVTRSFTEAEKALDEGKNVLLNPEIDDLIGLEGKFVQVFWSPVHFPNQPGTMGLLMNPKHSAFRFFPTEFHSNWQWWDLCKSSKTIEFGDMQVEPIVRVVDNFFKNRKLTNLFEAKVGDGMLVFSSIDLLHNLENRPAASQLLYSLKMYMSSDAFNPENTIEFEELKRFCE